MRALVMIFRAQMKPEGLCRATNTSPKAPFPSFLPIWKSYFFHLLAICGYFFPVFVVVLDAG
jgi:hypothetical protein